MHDMANEAIRSTLAHCAGEAPDSSAIAEAALGMWSRTSHRLEPVIGLRGVDALFNRALHVTCRTYPWLATTAVEEDGTAQLVGLRLRLASRDRVEAEEASYVLLMTFTLLLANLIGESLTKRLLAPVWFPPTAGSEEMSKP